MDYASLLFGNGFAIGIGNRIWLWLLHALFFIHARLGGYQETRWYIVRIRCSCSCSCLGVCSVIKCQQQQQQQQLPFYVRATCNLQRATCNAFCISSQFFAGIYLMLLSHATSWGSNSSSSIWIMEMIMRLCIECVTCRAMPCHSVFMPHRSLCICIQQEILVQLNTLYCCSTIIIATCRKPNQSETQLEIKHAQPVGLIELISVPLPPPIRLCLSPPKIWEKLLLTCAWENKSIWISQYIPYLHIFI